MNDIRKIYSDRCWINGKLRPATVCFEKGIITELLMFRQDGAEDFGERIIMPGLIDVHVHINEPGRTNWEGFDTATQAAAAGGITTVVDMPLNASPVTTNAQAFKLKKQSSLGKMNVNTGFYGGLVPGNAAALEGLFKSGVLGIKCFLTHSGIDEFPNVTEEDLDEAMPLIAGFDIPLLVHCEIESACENTLAETPSRYHQYLLSRPAKWEYDAVALMIRLCRKHHCRVHIVHVSSAETLNLVKKAKEEGLPVTAETCAHYIYFNAEGIPDGRCIYKCAPPIREKANNEGLKEGLINGTLDFITSDHSPAPPSIKEIESGNLLKAWGGIAGLQFLLPASWTALRERMPIEKFIPLVTEHPARFIGVSKTKGKIEIGCDADLLVWNPDQKMKITAENILFRHKISPYIGAEMFGVTEQTIVNGEVVYNKGSIISKNQGKWLLHL